jgi:excisionase family DNA binding protein
MEKTEPAYIGVREVADYLGISKRTAYSLVARGDIPSVRVGGQHRIPRSQLERHLAERATKGAAP